MSKRSRYAFESFIGYTSRYTHNFSTDCVLDLRDKSTLRVTGTILVRVEDKFPILLNATDIRKDVAVTQSMVEKAELDKSGRLEESSSTQIVKATYDMASGPGGLEQLKSAGVKLGRLVENLEPVMAVMDEASKVNSFMKLDINLRVNYLVHLQIHPYAQAAWNVISSLYKVSINKV